MGTRLETSVQNRIRSLNLNFRYMASRTYRTIHVHAFCNAVTLVWGSLRLVPTTLLNPVSVIVTMLAMTVADARLAILGPIVTKSEFSLVDQLEN